MGCSSCGGAKRTTSVRKVTRVADTVTVEPKKVVDLGKPVEASEDTSKKVRLRYYGGGVKKIAVTGTGCSTCRSGRGGYANVTEETITFVSEDEPNGLFRRLVTAGHDIFVTEKQAEYLLTLTYQNRGGEVVHKFQKVEA